MPVTSTLDGRLFVIRCEGSYGVDELRGAWDLLADNPAIQLPVACVLDLRLSESVLHRSIADLRSIASGFMRRAAIADNRVALVVRGAARYGLMRMAATWVELAGLEARVFRDPDEAARWALARLAAKRSPSAS